MRCVLLMHAYAAALQSTHGLTVGPRISKELWPVIEQVELVHRHSMACLCLLSPLGSISVHLVSLRRAARIVSSVRTWTPQYIQSIEID